MIHTLIADDHAIVRGGIKQILATTSDIVVVAEVGNGDDVVAQLCAHPVDVLLLDMTMPGLSGAGLIQAVRAGHPALPVLVLSIHNDPQTVTRALRAGASGYVTKDSDPQVLIAAVRRLACGGRFIDPLLVETVVFDAPSHAPIAGEVLSTRELQVLKRLAAGRSVNEIAAEFALSAKTISTHKMRLMQKLGVRSNAELFRYAIDNNVCTS
ncbi:LuxR family transcriptional regulator [Burkholderia ubonensis]|uniref:response regulator n=1 Tax=Burkholderia TaxID=32008 RepID=UPI0005ABC786|nr:MULTISPECIES: response regulator transcription factor [Burkholderia]KIP17127.1 bacterial regulatory s, luxR family protein [Burkholderia sp. MSHR3999]KVD13348.1 LuxR family transcriptional regulator [Burkholderia ubonensis]KVU16592.1 LuxR family transcriptional regulator [Burkholderia ubonensis]